MATSRRSRPGLASALSIQALRVLVLERRGQRVLERAGAHELTRQALDDTVLPERAADRLRQGPREEAVHRALDLGRGERLGERDLELRAAPDPRHAPVGLQVGGGAPLGAARRPERVSPRRAGRSMMRAAAPPRRSPVRARPPARSAASSALGPGPLMARSVRPRRVSRPHPGG
jgi:hypothetical protein